MELQSDAMVSRADERRTDLNVLLMTGVLWFANFGILVTRSAALGVISGWHETLVRLLASMIGAGSCLAVYASFRRRVMPPVRRFVVLLTIFVALSFALAAANEFGWLATTNYYQERYGLSATQILSGQCSANLGCGVFVREVVFTAASLVWVYVSWAALYIGALIAAELRNRDHRLAIAESAATEANLMALKFQLSPHFLFNTLNTLSGLVALGRKGEAEDVLINLSAFLRLSLNGDPGQMIPLAKEIEAQRTYLSIERARFADRLRVDISVSPECERARVPALIIQPLVENCIKHAVAPTEHEVEIRVEARRKRDHLEVLVGNSRSENTNCENTQGFGIGMENVRKRLRALYGDRARLVAGPTKDHGWLNSVEIPWDE